jgi:hypothetical protein
MSEEFNAKYIEKCVKARAEIEYLRILRQFGPMRFIPSALEEGDFFYHEGMGQFCVKRIQRIEDVFVFSEDGKAYAKDDCAWIPTREQLIHGIETTIFSLGDTSDLDAERILEIYMKEHDDKLWNEQKREWIKNLIAA